MSDSDIIKQAYEDTIQKLFAVLFDASVIAQNLPAQSEAEQQFLAGVNKAREVRDKAITLVS